MEKQRSFSLKSTGFLVFSLTIFSSLIFFIFFSIWLINSHPSIHQQTHLHFNRSSLNLTHFDFTTNFSSRSDADSFLKDTHVGNASSFHEFSILEEIEEQDDEIETTEPEDSDDVVISNSTEVRESAPGLSSEEIEVVQSREEENRANLSEKIELVSSGGNEEKKIKTASLHGNDGRIEEKKMRQCDITKGSWVYDASYPLYNSCSFIDEGFNCAGNGRLDGDYMKWRWQPQDCEIPRFNATRMLELIRGKRLVFVGDSINRNQWESMLCMLMGAIRDPKRVYETHGRRITKEKGNYCFKFVDYKCTVEYYVSHFLVHESKARIGHKRKQTLRIDAIDRGSSRWRGADILIFNTAHWWSHSKTKAGINYYQEGNQVHPQLDVYTAFRRALLTWASWVDKLINPRKTHVFFRNSAPSHFSGGQWNSGGHCGEATWPLNDTSSMSYPEKNKIVEDIIAQMKTPVTLLNVTRLSAYRIDGHPSIYRKKPVDLRSSSIQDCSHWCLPGVPDTWNELLYFHLQSKQGNRFHIR
ncbi:hypothetical protein SLEP1_g1475 [Rubroshorea leprosula]|uniref:Trichome birefringence-like N-terminal domain-containing protein n=1 Tax=Rubroshorea leprosula TaxID=152421 RepID=A0AAV5HN06_9ROSI|nr:hypothetical protein SLEP1_g1475 [Rubroshorea leprosula]